MGSAVKTVKVKVKPFPIKAKMTVGTETVDGQILKLTQTGFLIDANVPGLKTGAKFTIAFDIPLSKHQINEACVLVKLYTSIESHVLEGHFVSVKPESESMIMRFLHAVSKAPRSTDPQ